MFQAHQEDHDPHQDHPHHQQHFLGGGGHHAPPFMLLKRSVSFSGADDHGHHDHHHHHHTMRCEELLMHGGGGGGGGEDEALSDDGSQSIGGEKKKRLNLEQVKTLEKSFEMGNKLEPERKLHLAKSLGLQPRQVAIWFQNRRARWKTKQLEKDYDVLKKQFDLLKADNDALHSQNKKLHAQLSALKGGSTRDLNEGGRENHKKEGEGSWSNNGSENSSDVNLEISRTTTITQVINTCSSASSQVLNGKTLFPSTLRPTSITQLLVQGSPRSEHHPPHQMVQSSENENLCNMFVNGGVNVNVVDQDHQQGFWPWPEQPYFH